MIQNIMLYDIWLGPGSQTVAHWVELEKFFDSNPFYHLSDKLPNSNAGTVIFQNIQTEIEFIFFIALFGWLTTQTPEELSTADEASDEKYRATDTSQPANPESTDEEIMKFLEDSRKEKMFQFMPDDTRDFPRAWTILALP